MKVDPKKKYTAQQAAKFLKVTEATVKRHLRKKKGLGVQAGPKMRWYITGAGILILWRKWNLDVISD
jgi:predicted ArsR family transcriptional regulator